MTPSRQACISALPAEIQQKLRRSFTDHGGESAGIPQADRGDPLPLSFAQERMWLIHEFEPGGADYISALAWRLRGRVDRAALSRAVRGLVARHESLRTTFDEIDGRGVQVVHAKEELPLPLAEVSCFIDGSPDGLDRLLGRECSVPFDLRQGPLLWMLLVRLSSEEHILLLTAHQIITDERSMGILVDELSALYAAAARDDWAALPPLPVQYADYAAWQRDRLSGSALQVHLDYWYKQLADVAPLELPTDRPRPAIRTSAGATIEFELPAEVAAALTDLARSSDATLFMVLAAACQILLARWSGQDDIAVGTAVAGRDRPELEPIIGLFVNTVVLRSRIDAGSSFREFLGRVRGTVLDAFAHQDVPFEKVVDELQMPLDTSRSPLFQAMVVLHGGQRPRPAFSGLEVEPVDMPARTANFDVSVDFVERDGALAGVLDYNTDLFDATTMERMARHLSMLLAEVAADPDRPVGDLPPLGLPGRNMIEEPDKHPPRRNDMDDDIRYQVLRNDEDQYSLWPVGHDVPAGWYQVGKEGTKDECSAYVDEVWTDMRPRSLRERMDAEHAS
jgi:uncharacterized protein YbdZ (MbtH family)